MKHETALKAAQWWAAKLNTGGTDAKLEGENQLVSHIFGGMLQARARKQNTAEKVRKFTELLAEHLEAQRGQYVYIGVDYGPDYQLGSVCAAAEVDGSALPWKTSMFIDGDTVIVSEGYGGPRVELP